MSKQLPLAFGADTTLKQKRDAILDVLAAQRSELVHAARQWALHLVQENGTVTSPQVLARLREEGWSDHLDRVDARFMGVVFRKGWRRVGWENQGSHARPVSIWERE